MIICLILLCFKEPRSFGLGGGGGLGGLGGRGFLKLDLPVWRNILNYIKYNVSKLNIFSNGYTTLRAYFLKKIDSSIEFEFGVIFF